MTNDSGDDSGTIRRFSKRLSPQARKAAMLHSGGKTVKALVQLSTAADPEGLCEAVAGEGGEAGAWMEETRLLAVEIAAGRLEWLAEQAGVVYVDLAATYRP